MGRGEGQAAATVIAPRGSTGETDRVELTTATLADGSIREIYRDGDGRPHRDDGPAVVERDPEGQILGKWYCRHGQLHRDDGAAVMTYSDGQLDYEGYYQLGQLHRTDGPAEIEYLTGQIILKRWRLRGQLHREGKPAEQRFDPVEFEVNYEGYFQLGQLHRDDGPAENVFCELRRQIIRQTHYRNGQLHREDGPAVVELDPDDQTIQKALYFEQGEYKRKVEHYPDGRIKREIWPEGARPDQPTETRYHGNGQLASERWLKDGQLHREGGPALVTYSEDGVLASEQWFSEGKRHREDGPAKIEFKADGRSPERQEWWRDDQQHREDGPATILFNDEDKPRYRRFYLNGEAVKAGDLPG